MNMLRNYQETNQTLLERDNRHVLHALHNPETHLLGNAWIKGEGSFLYDGDGRQYIDAMSGLWNVTLGHGRSELIDAATSQMSTLAYCSGYSGNTNPKAIELGEKLASIIYPSINHFFFTSGGGESTDTTIKIARSYWKAEGKPDKVKIISMMGGYHGTTLGAMCATGMPSYWPAFEPRMPGFAHVPLHYRHKRPGMSDDEISDLAAADLENLLKDQGPDTVALFIIEPVMGGGAYVVPDGYFRRIREICDRYDVLLATDEVITGFGRTGKMFALEHWGVEPDIVQFAKGITSGYVPLGGVGISDRIAQAFERQKNAPWMHCYTYSGHPVACAVALATIDVLEKEDLVARAGRLGSTLKGNLVDELSEHRHVGDIRGLGLILAIDLVKDRERREAFDPKENTGARLLKALREEGLITRGRGDTIYIGPPFTIPEHELSRLTDIVITAVKSL